MTDASIKEAKAEAKRFLKRIDELLREMSKTDRHYLCDHPKHTGAVRRASMDLTRALAELRRP